MIHKRNIIGLLGALAFASGLTSLQAAEAEASGHLFILSGQSNMRQPLPQSFEEVVSKVFGKENVAVATFSVPSQPIRQWYKNWTPPEGADFQLKEGEKNGELYDKLMDSVRKKAGDRKFATVTFVWMQGEADGSAGWGAVYGKSFLGIIDQLKADLKRDDIRFVLGRINDHKPNGQFSPGKAAVREAQVKLGEEHANGDWVDTDDLNTGINPWSVYEANGEHFPNAGYRTLGQRFARAACKLIDPQLKLDETIFNAHFFNTAAEISTHAALGKQSSGTAPETGSAGLAALTDGAYSGNDPKGKGWVIFKKPELKTVELIVDLGKPQDVTAIAANLLVDQAGGIGFPAWSHLATSKDGQNYIILTTHRDNGFTLQPKRIDPDMVGPEARLLFFDIGRPEVRFIKLTFHLGDTSLFIDEIAVDPQVKIKRN
jgi:Carbohydrate esterase, sialic acid-specific acetylesterase